jgi:hypothetical protein
VEKESKKKMKRSSKAIVLSVLLISFGFEYAAGTPSQIPHKQVSAVETQGWLATGGAGGVQDKGNASENSTGSEYRLEGLEDQVRLISKISESESAETSKNDLAGESMSTNAISEPTAMLLFACALIGMASVGRKRSLKR